MSWLKTWNSVVNYFQLSSILLHVYQSKRTKKYYEVSSSFFNNLKIKMRNYFFLYEKCHKNSRNFESMLERGKIHWKENLKNEIFTFDQFWKKINCKKVSYPRFTTYMYIIPTRYSQKKYLRWPTNWTFYYIYRSHPVFTEKNYLRWTTNWKNWGIFSGGPEKCLHNRSQRVLIEQATSNNLNSTK